VLIWFWFLITAINDVATRLTCFRFVNDTIIFGWNDEILTRALGLGIACLGEPLRETVEVRATPRHEFAT